MKVSAQVYLFKSYFEKDSILLGDQINLVIEAIHKPDFKMYFPTFKDTIAKNIELVEMYNTDTVKKEANQISIKQKYLITCFDPGVYSLNRFPVVVTDGSVTDTIYADSIPLVVMEMPIDTAAIDTVFAESEGMVILGRGLTREALMESVPDSVKQSMGTDELNKLVDQYYQQMYNQLLEDLYNKTGIVSKSEVTDNAFAEIIAGNKDMMFIFSEGGRLESYRMPMIIKELFVKEYQSVKKGDKLFSYYLIKDVKKPFDAEWSFWEDVSNFIKRFYIYFILFVLLAAAAYFIYRYYQKKKLNAPVPEIPREPAHIIAFRSLTDLKEKKLWQANKIKEYHSELTEIIRRYIEHRFRIMALEQTTAEIMADIEKHRALDETNFKLLKQTLELADLVKFAKLTPLPDENDVSMRNSWQLVDNTKQVEEIKPEKENNVEPQNSVEGE
ncbi:MAG: hypothetical protein A2W91_01570 [Bacteroidetes bacterium GWF2_38_335]|nr:MAG: hypothetical protein A2W91_01570 [Bacteroidetes bacterium GWF2_38_335]OFY78762.1 MAG: hypothetical protein A2281_19145 [Bacteroidetes bacterium RIFOXYA12_FULL_38_20]HBS85152.1 hypothetical protein [Bacteroidales bacterium]